jgi:hypothetical protein
MPLHFLSGDARKSLNGGLLAVSLVWLFVVSHYGFYLPNADSERREVNRRHLKREGTYLLKMASLFVPTFSPGMQLSFV